MLGEIFGGRTQNACNPASALMIKLNSFVSLIIISEKFILALA